MLCLGGIIDSTPEYVKNTAIHVPAQLTAELGIEKLGISAPQFCRLSNPEKIKIRSDRRSNSGDTRQPGNYSFGNRPESHWSDHTASSFPLGSAK